MERKLAAILAADVAGFSRLMEADEEATLETLRGHRQVVQGLVADHHGSIFGGAGDSLLAEFPSAVQAVECALRIQEELGRRNAALAKERSMDLRIGVNVGDVMVTEDGLYGDGVNVADRLQKLAPPGGICISDSAYLHVHKVLPLGYRDLGRHSVKNIAEPVRAYRLRAPAEGAARPRVGRRRAVLAALMAVALIAAGAFAAWLRPWAPEAARENVAFPDVVRPTRHFRVERPADLADSDALTIYERIRDEMVAAYANSGLDEVQDYTTWRQYNTAPYLSSQHGSRYLNNYANDAAATYGQFEQAGELPAGAIIAKDSFEVTQRGDVLTGPLFLMEKMPEGFSEQTADWRYTMIMPDGRIFGRSGGENAGRVAFCAECHRLAGDDDDHLYFVPEGYRRQFLRLGDGNP